MKANSEKTKQSNKATRRVLAGVLCGASVLSLVLSLVMPPISQAIANDAQTGAAVETVADGVTGVDGTNVNTENQNGGAIEGGEDDPSNGVEQGQSGDQPEGKLQVEDDESSDGNAVMAAAGGVQTKAASDEIKSVSDLKTKLENASGIASFKLMNDVETSETIQLSKDGSNITLDLNGHKIKHKSSNQPLFNITGGATLTVKDGDIKEQTDDQSIGSPKTLSDQGENLTADNYGKKAEPGYDSNGIPTSIPTSLTYYVTESVANETRTTETLKAYKANIQGAIVACGGDHANGLKLINLYDNGHFKLESGTLTQKQGDHVGNLIYAENGSTVTVDGGYICGADTGDSGAGAGIEVTTKGKRSTFKMTGGVIAGNSAPSGAGVFAEDYVNASDANKDNEFTKGHPTVEMTGGIITGNYTRDSVNGHGGGIMASGGSVTVSGGYITNNKYAKYCGNDGWGDHGGAGLAAKGGTHVTISGGQITGNYSEEAGGGVYVTDVDRNKESSRTGMAWLNITGGTIASNVSFRSEGAGIRVGQMVDALINGTASSVYITNNHCMSRFDWGGGGIFVQGNSNEGMEKTAGRLFVYNSYISSNTAGGYGGGVAVCPTGKTLVTNTTGTAIFGNASAGDVSSWHDNYNKTNNSGNDGIPHLSGGGSGKNQDKDAYGSDVFRTHGHADFFLAAHEHTEPIAAVIGKMLGGVDAKYSGSIELEKAITIPANGGVQVKKSIGLSSGVQAGSNEAAAAQKDATTFITGNYSWDHGGGIMSNGDLYLGQPADTYVYPSLKLKATKALKNKQTGEEEALTKDQFSFAVYRKDSATATMPSWNKDSFSDGGCTLVGSAKNDANGNITFDLGEQFIDKTVEAGKITYYLVEQAGGESGIKYDHTVYEIEVQLRDDKTLLMNVPKKDSPNEDVPLYVHNCTITSVSATEYSGDSPSPLGAMQEDNQGYYPIANSEGSTTFTNKIVPPVSWTPKATKVVEGGEMKKFTLQLAKDSSFKDEDIVGTAVTSVDNTKQTLSFSDASGKEIELKYSLSDITANPDTAGDPTGRGASKTFYYYVREKDESSTNPHYKFDPSVYRFKVVVKDDTEGRIDCAVTYRKGTVNSEGEWENADTDDHVLTEESTPTFTNTYSTSLPLSGMSGVTLTYLAGAAVLCAAAAWMHIRRKANAKGGERRE